MSKTSAAATTSRVVRGVAGRVALRKALLMVMVLSVLVVLPAVPAAADHEPPAESHEPAGTGSLEGTELVEEMQGFPCFRVTRHLYGVRGAGTYEGRTAGGGPVVFRGEVGAGETLHADGPLQVQFENTEVYYHSPFGTHGTEASGGAGCSPSTVGNPVPAEFRVFAAEGTVDTDGDTDVDVLTGQAWVYRVDEAGDKVPCRGQGTYARGTKSDPMFGDPAWVAEWTLEEDCVVVGNEAGTPGTGETPRGTFHTHHGKHGPCFNGPCTRNLQTGYAQFIPKPGPFLTMSGPASAVVGCEAAATVTARLTVDGIAEPDVPVAFAVDGPAPAVPPGGAGITGSDGRADFTFTAAAAGDYTVTATVVYDGEQKVATHTVRFDELPPLSVTLTGFDKGQTEEATTVRATVRDACGVLPGAPVDFSVAWTDQDKPWTGQATPASGSGVTDALGEAEFSYSGDRAGQYTVTATTSLAVDQASDTHTTDLVINTLKRVGSIPFADEGEASPALSAVDPAGDYAYFGTGPRTTYATKVVKFDLATFQRVAELPTPATIYSLVMDPGGDYAYAADIRGRVHKLDLGTFAWVDTLTIPPRPNGHFPDLSAPAVIDPAGDYLYVGNRGSGDNPSQVLKIDLGTFALVDVMDMEPEVENAMELGVMDPNGAFAYFTFDEDLGARVVKIDLGTFQRAGTALLPTEERYLASGTIDPAGEFAYFGTGASSSPGRVVKVDLATMQRVGAITLHEDKTMFGQYPVDRSEQQLRTALMDPAGRYAYFGTEGRIGSEHPSEVDVPVRLIRIDLDSFTRAESVDLPPETENESFTGVIDPTGSHAYLGASQADVPRDPTDSRFEYPGLVAKVQLFRPPNPALVAGDDAYATSYETPLTVPAPGVLANDTDTADGDPLVAGQASDPPGGSVDLAPDGSLAYTPGEGVSGADAFTYTASDGIDYSETATVSVEVDAPAEDIAEGLAFNYLTDVSLFGGPSTVRGYGQPADAPASAASPSVACPDGGGVDSAADADGARAVYGPAVIFGGIFPEANNVAPPSGPMTSAIDCQPGAEGHVTASTSVTRMPAGSTWGDANEPHPGGVGPGPFIADQVDASCTITPDGVDSTVTIANGVLETKYDPNTQEPVEVQDIPESPPADYTLHGTIDHVGDSYRAVFNEQVDNPDGSFTVNAVHLYLLGPTAVGDVVIGSSTCGPLTTGVPPDPGAIAGTVTDADSGALLAGATVTAGGQTATTDADGTYLIDGVEEGAHTVTADATGYQAQSQDAAVAEGETVTVDFALAPHGADTGIIAGMVTDAGSGARIAGATVTAGGQTATTDADGAYLIDGVQAGDHTVTADADGYQPGSQNATVTAGETVTVDFALQAHAAGTGAVAGTVTDTDSGDPVAGASVTAVDVTGAFTSTTSDAAGAYQIAGLDPGSYTVTAAAEGYQPGSQAATVQEAQTTPVDFALTPSGGGGGDGGVQAGSGSAYGYFTDVSLFGGDPQQRGPAPTVQLASDMSNSPQHDSVESASAEYGPAEIFRSGPIAVDAEGALGPEGFVATAVNVLGDPDPEQRPGPFLYDAVDATCTADAGGVTATTEITGGILETKYDENTQEPTETEPVPTNPDPNYTRQGTIDHVGDSYTIVFNEQVTNPDGSMTVNAAHMYLEGPTAVGDVIIGQATCGATTSASADTGAVAGTVTDADSGALLAGATVTAGGQTATTDANGAYQIDGLDAGAYTVTADATGYQAASHEATVTAGETTTVDFALTAHGADTGAIAGTVTDVGSDAPVAGATVTAGGQTATTNADGAYEIDGLDAGAHTVTAEAAGYLPASQDATVTAGETVTVDLALQAHAAGTGAIAGTVTGADAPIAGATVTAGGQTATTDADGAYQIAGLDPGTHTVSASADGYQAGSQDATVTAGETRTVDFTLASSSGDGDGDGDGDGEECPVAAPEAAFTDRDDIPDAHAASVDCAAAMDIVRGFADGQFKPRLPVTRAQMASFIFRTLQAAQVELPPADGQRFTDVAAGSAHDEAIHRLAAAGIVHGGPLGTDADSYGPQLRTRRDQMTSFLMRAAGYALHDDPDHYDDAADSGQPAFADVPAGNTHYGNVNAAGDAGIARGFTDGTYRPAATTRRDQMSSFVVRLLTMMNS